MNIPTKKHHKDIVQGIIDVLLFIGYQGDSDYVYSKGDTIVMFAKNTYNEPSFQVDVLHKGKKTKYYNLTRYYKLISK